MQRLLILLLMFLLPMQVFAGMSESQANAAAVASLAVQQEVLQDAPACQAGGDCDQEDIAIDDIEMHVDLGDETVPAFPLVFAAAAIVSTPALSNDKALQPPFLPPAGPPPRA